MDAPGFSLAQFVQAQQPVYDDVRAELSAGRKQSHWMWFIFPQLTVLGRSAMARLYGLASAQQALDYWQHPVLGPRLLECTQLVLGHRDRTAHEIFGSPDDLKFRSCMTLFAQVAVEEPSFGEAIGCFYAGLPDAVTLDYLKKYG